MQTVRSILQISSRGVRLTDEYGSQTGVDLEIMLGTAVRLEFDLRGESGADGGELAVYPAESLNSSSNYFALDSRTRNSNAPALLKYSGITLCQNADGYNIMTVELENNATEKVIESIASQENGIFRAEIGGVDSNGLTVFAWQFDISIRSRVFIGEADETITGDPAYYTAAQTITLINGQCAAVSNELSAELAENMSNPTEFQFSIDGTSSWHGTQTVDDRYYRQRIANLDAEWSTAIQMPAGSGSGSGMTETEIKNYVDTQIDEKFENLATTEW